MDIGKLDTYVRIDRPGAPNSIGGSSPGWSRVDHCWASILAGSGLERVKAGVELSSVNVSIRIRYMPGLDATMRIVSVDMVTDADTGLLIDQDLEIYEILAVPPKANRSGYLDLVCRAGANDG